MLNNRRELTYSGMAPLVSTALLKCFQTFGTPVNIIHGEDSNVYAEFKSILGTCTFYTTKINEYIFSIHIAACPDTSNMVLDELEKDIKKSLNDPSLFNLVLLQGDES